MFRLSITLALCVALAACATNRLSEADQLALHREHAGAPVKDFTYFGNINGWSPIDESTLVVWTRPSEAYLLDLNGPCQDIEFAPAITLTNLFGRVTLFDKVIVHGGGSGTGRIPCHIREIRPLGVKGLKQAQGELREARVAERDAGE